MKECVKPKRDRGSCYECGAQEHLSRSCSRKLKTPIPTGKQEQKETPQITSVIEIPIIDNEYLGTVEFLEARLISILV